MKYKSRKAECATCGLPKTSMRSAYCKRCRAARMRRWREDHGESQDQAIRKRARALAKEYARRGCFDRSACAACRAKERIELHHPDYEKPLEVIALCESCHRQLHDGSLDASGLTLQRHVQLKDQPPRAECSRKCGRERRPGQRLCRVCHAAEMRVWRAKREFVLRGEAR